MAAPPRIGIDARLGAYRGGGIAEHVRRLVEGLAALDLDERVVLLAHRRSPPNGAAPLETRRLRTPPHHRLEDLALPLELAPARLDLLHSPDVVPPRLWRRPSVITVHDVAFLRRPELLTVESRRYYGRVQRAVRQAARVIVVSEHTRRELLARTNADPERVRVIHNAVHPRFRQPADPDADRAVIRRLGLAEPYLLFVSTIEPRKNVMTLLDAYRLLLDRLPEGERAVPTLVLAGADGWHSRPVYDHAQALGLGGHARFLGWVDAADLPALYRRATLLAHPALDEGFGLTPVEAMAAGTPVVVSDAGSLPEVVADAGLRVAPSDPAAWCTALGRLLDDGALRADFAARGRARAARFTRARMAVATLAVYREALGTTPGAPA
jgi:glycosyltransferase involved in cell wall biosynthesis